VDVKELVAALRSTIEGARSMPMSASAVVNRSDLLELVGQLEAALPTAFADSDKVVSERTALVSQGREEAAEIVARAKAERERILSDTEVFMFAKSQADKERAAATRECEELRKDTDDYVDTKLANLEVTLTKTLEAVSRGRDRLRGRSELDQVSLDAAAESADHKPFPHLG
jgi:hypothetical protein